MGIEVEEIGEDLNEEVASEHFGRGSREPSGSIRTLQQPSPPYDPFIPSMSTSCLLTEPWVSLLLHLDQGNPQIPTLYKLNGGPRGSEGN